MTWSLKGCSLLWADILPHYVNQGTIHHSASKSSTELEAFQLNSRSKSHNARCTYTLFPTFKSPWLIRDPLTWYASCHTLYMMTLCMCTRELTNVPVSKIFQRYAQTFSAVLKQVSSKLLGNLVLQLFKPIGSRGCYCTGGIKAFPWL